MPSQDIGQFETWAQNLHLKGKVLKGGITMAAKKPAKKAAKKKKK
jgi:hypothetical protein